MQNVFVNFEVSDAAMAKMGEERVSAIRILGIDPGLRRTGWGLVTIEGSRLRSFVACGTVRLEREGRARRAPAPAP